jgi:hypothetical protein
MNLAPQCATCKFYDSYASECRHDLPKLTLKKTVLETTCIRYEQTLATTVHSYDSMWPPVMSSYWCGQWQAKTITTKT